MNFRKGIFILGAALAALCQGCKTGDGRAAMLAPTPPMGWNSWICFGTSATEDEIRANADYMARNLREFGWEYIVIDGGWYAPGMVTLDDYLDPVPDQLIDEYGRLVPDPAKYPSAAEGGGLKPLADYIHSNGLKLGIHIMRGIPIQAVERNTPIKGAPYRARDIYMENSRCDWYHGFYGVDMSKPGAQEYYDSIFELYESWGVDYVKADDLLSPVYACDEITAIGRAAKKLGRPVVLSLSPGPAPLENIRHLREVSELWRVSEDFWDNWESLKEQFPLCAKWAPYITDGSYPDADMLPVGRMAQRAMRGDPRPTNFTADEQYTMMSLWAMARSPLMLGCNLPEMDDFTLSLVTNAAVLRINQHSGGNSEFMNCDGFYGWFAADKDNPVDYIAIFNTNDYASSNHRIDLSAFGQSYAEATELWTGAMCRVESDSMCADIAPHGVALFKLLRK